MNIKIGDIKSLIANAQTEEALEILLFYLSGPAKTGTGVKGVHKEIIVLSSRYSELSKKFRLGIIDETHFNLERNRINVAILEILEKLESRVETLEASTRTIFKYNKIIIAAVVGITIFFLFFVYSFYQNQSRLNVAVSKIDELSKQKNLPLPTQDNSNQEPKTIKAQEIRPTVSPVYSEKGQNNLETKNIKTLAEQKNQDEEMITFKYDMLLERGIVYLENNEYSLAKETYEEALKVIPNGAEAKFGLRTIEGFRKHDEAYVDHPKNYEEGKKYAKAQIPPQYENVSINGKVEKKLIKNGQWTEWREILCGTKYDVNDDNRNTTIESSIGTSKIAALQRILKDKGYYFAPIDGKMNKFLWVSIYTFEVDKSTGSTSCLSANRMDVVFYPKSTISMRTLKVLGLE